MSANESPVMVTVMTGPGSQMSSAVVMSSGDRSETPGHLGSPSTLFISYRETCHKLGEKILCIKSSKSFKKG